MRQLRGLRVVITGASAGIGAELARQLARRGCRLLLAARRADRLSAVTVECAAAGAEAACQLCDVTSRQQLEALVAKARAHWGELDVWVNNAGRGLRQRVLDLTDEQYLELQRMHVLAPLWVCQALLPQWLATSHAGQIVDICSLAAKAGYPYNGAYAAAKHAMSAMGDSLRHELAGSGITLTTVYPGPVSTEFGQASPDLTGGASAAQVSAARASGNWLVRAVASPQSAEHVARCIVRTLERRSLTAYPHRWALAAVLLANCCPGLAIGPAQRR